MNQHIPPSEPDDVDDLAEAIREGRPLRHARAYAILVADQTLADRKVHVEDPVPVGRQILRAAGAEPVDEFSLFAMLPDGDFAEVRLDEPFDLRGHGAERFVMFRTDRIYKFAIDNRPFEWGVPLISGAVLRRLAGVKPTFAVYLEVRGGQDRPIGDKDTVDLSAPGIERFITVIEETTEGLAALPSADRAYLLDHGIEHELVANGQPGVILKGIALPEGRYDHPSADVLILLPPGYPDACPDMFYLSPWVKLKGSAGYPRCADVPQDYCGRRWQRWSRHSSEWRPGIDGLHTMIARVNHALETAR